MYLQKISSSYPIPTDIFVRNIKKRGAQYDFQKHSFKEPKNLISFWIDFVNSHFKEHSKICDGIVADLSSLENTNLDDFHARVIALPVGESLAMPIKISTSNEETILALRFFRENDQIRCRVMDHALGHLTGFHGTAPRFAYRLPDILLDAAKFDGELGKVLIERLISTVHNKAIKEPKEAVAQLLLAVGSYDQKDSIFGDSLDPANSTAMRCENGNGIELAIKLYVRDRLIENGYQKKDIGLFFWQARLNLLQQKSEVSRAEMTAFIASTSRLTHRGWLNQEQLETAEKLINNAVGSEEMAAGVSLRNLQSVEITLPPIESKLIQAPVLSIKPTTDLAAEMPMEASRPTLSVPATLDELNQLVSNYQSYCKEQYDEGNFLEVTLAIDDVLQHLPKVSSQFWDQIPADQAIPQSTALKNLLALGIESSGMIEGRSPSTALFVCEGFALITRLLRRDERLCLQNYGIRNPLEELRGLSWQGEEAHRFYLVDQYFESLPREGSIFDFSRLEINYNYRTYIWRIWGTQLDDSLAFLKQVENVSSQNDVKKFLEQFVNDPKNEIQTGLQTFFYFNYLAHFVWKDHLGTVFAKNRGHELNSCYSGGTILGTEGSLQTLPFQSFYRQTKITDKGLAWALKPGHSPSIYAENDVMLAPLPDQAAISQSMFHELSRIAQDPRSLRIHALLDWCLKSPAELSNPELQSYVETILFSGSILQKTIRNEPVIIERLRSFVDRMISSSLSNRASKLFWIRVSYFLETHFATISDTGMNQDRLSDLEAQLNLVEATANLTDEDRTQIVLLRIVMLGHISKGKLTPEQLLRLTQLRLHTCTVTLPKSPLSQEAEAVYIKHQAQLGEMLDDASQRAQAFASLPKYGCMNSGTWEGQFPLFRAGDFTINMQSRRIYYQDQPLISEWPENLSKNPIIQRFLSHKPSSLIGDHSLQTADGQFTCIFDAEQTILYRQITINGENKRYRFIENSDSLQIHIELSDLSVWVEEPGDGQTPKHCVLMTSQGPLGLYDLDNRTIAKLNQDGKPTGEYLVPFNSLAKDSQDYLRQILNPRKALLWASQDVFGEYKLSLIEYPQAGLTFTIGIENSEMIATCTAFPDDVLEDSQGIALAGASNTIALRSRDGKKRLLIIPEEAEKPVYYLYRYNTDETILHPASDAAALHLILLSLKTGNIQEAFTQIQALNPIRYFQQEEWGILSAIAKIAADNPVLIALRLQFAAQIVENETIHLKGRRYDPSKETHDGFWATIANDYAYWTTFVSKSSQKVPAHLNLTAAQHTKIIAKLQQTGHTTLKPQKKVRFEAEPTQSSHLLKDIGYYSFPTIWNLKGASELEPLDLRQTVKLKDLESRFFLYYEEAMNQPPGSQIDLDLQTLSLNPETLPLARILQIIRKNPEVFKEIKKGSHNYFLADKIVDKARTLAKKEITTPTVKRPKVEPADPKPERLIIGQKKQKTTAPVRPLEHLFNDCFERIELQADPESFALAGIQCKSPLAQRMLNNLEQAHQLNQKEPQILYQLRDNIDLKERIKFELTEIETKSQKTLDELITQANYNLDSNIHYRLRKRAGLEQSITLTNLIPAFITGNYQEWKELNPHLNDHKISKLSELLSLYLQLRSQKDQCEAALHEADEEMQNIGAILDKDRRYDWKHCPELLVYEYATGQVLRPRQTEILQWIFNTRDPQRIKQLLFEFEAGGGKTKVVAALLIFRYLQEGLMPVFFSLPELNDITKEDLRETLGSIFQIKLSPLEIGLNDVLTAKQLKQVFGDLNSWHNEGRCLQLTPETYHSLCLQYRLALDQEDKEKVKWLSLILFEFFEEKTVFLIDEADKNVDALWQAIVAAGEARPLDISERKLHLETYAWLSGYRNCSLLKDGRSIADVVQLQQEKRSPMTKEESAEVFAKLADFYIDFLGLPKDWRAFLTNRAEPIPKQLGEWDRSKDPAILQKAQTIFLARGMILDILPMTLQKELHMDFGQSLRPNDHKASPRKNKIRTLADYKHPDIASALTCQLWYQMGLQTCQIKDLIKLMLQEYLAELDGEEKGTAFDLFLRWQGKVKTPIPLDHVDLEDEVQMEQFVNTIGKNPATIEFFLERIALLQVETHQEEFCSSHADLIDGAAEAVLCSATLGPEEQYLYQEVAENAEAPYRDDIKFQAAVVQRFCSPRNSQILWEDPCDPKTLFKRVFEQAPANASRRRGLIDIGGWTAQYSTEEVADQFLTFNEETQMGFDGVVYIKESGSLGETTPMLKIKDASGQLKTYALKGSNLNQALKVLGFQPNKLKLFKIFGPSQTTGTDLFLEPDTEMIITVGEGLTLANQIQASMRLRQLLKFLEDPNQGQGLLWVGPKSLQNLLKSNDYSVRSIAAYALHKGSSQLEQTIVARAFIHLEHGVRKIVNAKLKEKLANPAEQIKIYQKHRSAFVIQNLRDTASLYGPQKAQPMNTLEQTWSNYLSKAQLKQNEVTAEQQKTVQGVIKQTNHFIPNLASAETTSKLDEQMILHNHNVSRQVGTQIHGKFENKDLMRYGRLRGADEDDYATKALSLISPTFFENRIDRFTIPDSFSHPDDVPLKAMFGEDSWYFRNALIVVHRMWADRLRKPALYFLFVEEGDKRVFAAVSGLDADIYRKQIENQKVSENRKVLLMTTGGTVIKQHGYDYTVDCQKDPYLLEQITKFNVVLGVNRYPKVLTDIIRKQSSWKDGFEGLLKEIHESSIDRDGLQLESMKRLHAAVVQESQCPPAPKPLPQRTPLQPQEPAKPMPQLVKPTSEPANRVQFNEKPTPPKALEAQPRTHFKNENNSQPDDEWQKEPEPNVIPKEIKPLQTRSIEHIADEIEVIAVEEAKEPSPSKDRMVKVKRTIAGIALSLFAVGITLSFLPIGQRIWKQCLTFATPFWLRLKRLLSLRGFKQQ